MDDPSGHVDLVTPTLRRQEAITALLASWPESQDWPEMHRLREAERAFSTAAGEALSEFEFGKEGAW